jgi:hypothetical protein
MTSMSKNAKLKAISEKCMRTMMKHKPIIETTEIATNNKYFVLIYMFQTVRNAL